MKRAFSVLLALAIFFTVLPAAVMTASAAESNNFTYTVADSKATVTGYTGEGGAVTIPAVLDGNPVTAIGDNAFLFNSKVTSVIIPDSVTAIGNSAFSSCIELTTVTIGNGVITIGESAFLLCVKLTDVTIPNSVTTIGNSAFRGCTALTVVSVGSGVTTIGGSAFSEDIRLDEVYFLGNAPTMGDDTLGLTLNYKVYYLTGKTGYTETWNGHSTTAFPATPLSPSAVSGSYNSIKISWTKSPGPVTGYMIFRYNPATTIFNKLNTTTLTEYTDTNLKTGEAYYYKVKSYVTIDGVTYYSASTDSLTAKPCLAAPGSASAVSNSVNSIKISWDAVTGATGYLVFRYDAATSTYKRITATPSLFYIDTLLTFNKSYSYKVKAFVKVGEDIYYSESTLPLDAKPALAAPASPVAKPYSCTGIAITWQAVASASGYMVFRLNPATGIYSRIKVTTLTNFTDTNLTTGQTYSYKIKAYIKSGDNIIYGVSTPVVTATATTPAPASYVALRSSDTSIRIAWSKVSSATGYVVYRYNPAISSYERIKVTKSIYYINTGLAKGVTYTYKVAAYTAVDGKNVYSKPTAAFKATT